MSSNVYRGNGNKQQLKTVALITKSLNKKGRIKGKNKKETKALKNACGHHYYSKKGKVKPLFFNDNNGHCICEACNSQFQTAIESKSEVKEIVAPVINLADQAVVAAISGNLGAKTVEKITGLKVVLHDFHKDYAKIMKAVSKRDNLSKRKKKTNTYGSASYGSWGRQRS